MRSPISPILIMAFTLFLACGIFENEQDPLSGDLVPLALGNYWDYHRWYISPNIADTIREEVLSEHTFMVDRKAQTIFGYQQFYKQQHKRKIEASSELILVENKYGSTPAYYKSKTSEPEYEWLRANGENGLLSFGGLSQTDTLILKKIQYRYPGHVGEQQEFPTLSYSFSELQFTVQDTIAIETISSNGTFESEWGTYKGCYVYRFQEIGKGDAVYIWDHYVYIKPGIGVVAIDTRQHYSGGEDPEDLTIGQWVLINYKLNH